jgi:hypothetical protein
MGRHTLIVVIAATVLLSACAREPAAARPREGAPVAGAVQVAANDALAAAPPPTLAPIAALATTATPARPSPAASPTMVPTHVIMATGGMPVNLRAGPSTAAPVITTLREGTSVEALGEPISVEGRGWQEVRSESRQGWVVAVVVRRR